MLIVVVVPLLALVELVWGRHSINFSFVPSASGYAFSLQTRVSVLPAWRACSALGVERHLRRTGRSLRARHAREAEKISLLCN